MNTIHSASTFFKSSFFDWQAIITMKKLFLFIVAFVATLSVSAQDAVAFRFGCISYNQVLLSMPEYAQAENDLITLKAKYDAEMKASEDEFNAKYETFLSEQNNYAPSILRKRQQELEDMMQRNEKFRLESIRLLAQAEKDMVKSAKDKLDAAIRRISEELQLAFVLNTDDDAVPYLNKAMAYNITEAVTEAVKHSVVE